MTSDFIRKALKARYTGNTLAPEWLVLFEVRTNTGYHHHGLSQADGRYIDAVALNCWASKDYKRIAFEIKVSKGDFMNEIKDPYKRLRGTIFFDEFYFVAPIGIIPRSLLPKECGLMEVNDEGGVRIVQPAPKNDPPPFSDTMLLSLLRRAYQQGGDDAFVSIRTGTTELYQQAYKNLLLVEEAMNKGETLVKPNEVLELANRLADKAKKLLYKEDELFPDIDTML
jgi:hypothetical protein